VFTSVSEKLKKSVPKTFFHVYRKKVYLPIIPRVTDVERMKNGTPCNLHYKSLYHALLRLDPIRQYSLNTRFARCTSWLTEAIMLNGSAKRISHAYKSLFARISRGTSGNSSSVRFELRASTRDNLRWYVGIESRCTLIRFFQCD